MYRVKGCLAALLAVLNVLVMAVPFFSAVLVKILIPLPPSQRFFTRVVTALARQYNFNNGLIFKSMSAITWRISGLNELDKQHSYLVVANHQSWADIPVLQTLLEPHIPLLKFFLKKQLIWVPVLGAAWWALDFPFMRRYSREYLEKHPEKRGEDMAETRRMCARFAQAPVSVMSFVEGTRYTLEKSQRQGKPFQTLLKPKVGGLALAINSLGENMTTLLNVTLDYRPYDGDTTIWKLFSGQITEIHATIEAIPIPAHFALSDYENDPTFRLEIQQWIEDIWRQKDEHLLASRRAENLTDLNPTYS